MLARKSSRALVGLALLIGFVFGTSSLAGAHAVLLSLAPEPDAVLAASPPEVVLAFSEPVSATSKAIRVFDPTGEEISGIHPDVENSVLSAKLPTLTETGSYTVAWKVVSDDGHQVSGAFLFHLKEATLKAPVAVGYEGAAALPRVLKVIGAVLTWAGLIYVLGMCAVAVRGSLGRSRVLAGLGVLSLGTLISFASSVLAVDSTLSESLDVALGTSSGRSSLVALVLSLLALVLAAVMLRSAGASGDAGPVGASRSTRLTIQVAAVAVLIAAALEGHALALSPVALSATFTVLHVVAAVAWIAGLFWIEQRSRTASPEDLAVDVRRRSPWAMGLVLVLHGSGLGLMIDRVPLADLLSSGYGRLGSLKLILLAMAIPLAWMNRSMFVPKRGAGGGDGEESEGHGGEQEPIDDETVLRFRRTVHIEMLLLAAALVAGSVLAQISPPGDAAGFGGGSFSQKLPFGDGQVELTIDPGTRGMNEVHVTALGPDGRLMAGIEDLELSMSLASKEIGPLQPTMQVIVPGHSVSYARFPFAGRWKVVASAKVDKFTELSATFDVTIGD